MLGKTYTVERSPEQTSWRYLKRKCGSDVPPLPLSGARRKNNRRDNRVEEQAEEVGGWWKGGWTAEPTATVIYFQRRSIKVSPAEMGPLMPARRKVNACRCSCARNRRKQREEGEGEKEEERAEERSNANNASDDPHCARTHNSRDTD